jgi:hypothetical protein
MHDWYLTGAVVNLLDSNGLCGACVDDARVVLNRDELTFVIKHAPVLLKETVHLVAEGSGETR